MCKDHIADALHSRRDELKALNFKASLIIPSKLLLVMADAWLDECTL